MKLHPRLAQFLSVSSLCACFSAAFAATLYAAVQPGPLAAETARPNVVFFLADDMGWMDCGVYGSQYYETPNIDRFARRAMRFTQAYAQPLCSPTRASLLSGQYSARHGVTTASGHQPPQPPGHRFLPESAPPHVPMLAPESRNYLEPSQITLAETLRAAGYRTAHIGKWHLGLTEPHWPERQGFDVAWHCHPDPGPPGNYFSPYGVTASGNPTGRSRVGTITDGPQGEYIVDRQAEEAVLFIRANRDRPFFLNLWCYGVHGPWGHKEEYTRLFAAKKDPTGRQGNPIMASMLRSVDECFGRILEELERQRLADRTLIIFNSDNGGNVHSNVPDTAKTAKAEKAKNPMLSDWRKWAGNLPPTSNAPLRDGKGTLYEGGTRVPLLWAWAGRIQPGTTSDAVVGPIDLYPTVLDLLGLPKPAQQHFDGVSYARVLRSEGSLEPRAYFNYHPHAGRNRAGGVWVRRGDFKLLRWFGRPDTHELYDLREDLGETNDLAERRPELVRELSALIDGFLRDTGATYPRPNPFYQGSTAPGGPKGGRREGGAAATPASPSDPLGGWKERQCKVTVSSGIATMVGTGAPGTAFLGHALGRMSGPIAVRMRVRSADGGAGRVECHPKGPGSPEDGVSAAFSVPGGDWQELSVPLAIKGAVGTLRLFLPATRRPVEIDWIEVAPSQGQSQRWNF